MAKAGQQSDKQTADRERAAARVRPRGGSCPRGDANVAGIEVLHLRQFALAVEKLFVNAALGLCFAFELREFHHLRPKLAALRLRGFKLPGQVRLTLLCFEKRCPRRAHHAGDFRRDLTPDVCDLRVETRDGGMARAEHGQLIRGLSGKARIFRAKAAEGGRLDGLGKAVAGRRAGFAQQIIMRARFRRAGVGEHRLLVQFEYAALQQRAALTGVGDLEARLEFGRRLFGAAHAAAKLAQSVFDFLRRRRAGAASQRRLVFQHLARRGVGDPGAHLGRRGVRGDVDDIGCPPASDR